MNDQEFITFTDQESEELVSVRTEPTSEQARVNLFQVLKEMFREQYKRDLTPGEEVKLEIILNAQIKAMQPQKSRKLTISDITEMERSFQRSHSERDGGKLEPSEVMMPSQESVELYYQKYGTQDNPYPCFVCKPIELEANVADNTFEKKCEEQVKQIAKMLGMKNEES